MEQLPKIVQKRMQATAKAGVHPDPDLLTAFAEKSLNERERAQVLQHLGQCADCRDVVSLSMPAADLVPATIPVRSPWLTWPALRWGALAACVVIVSAAVTLHYERRPDVTPMVSEKAPAPAAPSNLTVESKLSGVPNEKLAAKIPPPSPFQTDRDLADKLASPRKETDTRSAPANTFDQLMSKKQAIGGPKTNSSLDRQVTSNREPDAGLFKGANKPFPATGRLAASAAASPAAITPEPGTRNDNNLGQSVNETVTIQAEPSTIVAQSAERKAKDESPRTGTGAGATAATSPGDLKADTATAGAVAGAYGGQLRAKALPARIQSMPRWALSATGAVQRSLDSGKTWQTIMVANNVVFRAIAANDSDVWAGGLAGALYHSSDAGEHWTRANVLLDGRPLTADIIRVEFSDSQHGRLVTGTDETWVTSDGGASWRSQ